MNKEETSKFKNFDSSKTESFGSARNSEEFRHAQKSENMRISDIKKQAKKIMDSFASALEKSKVKEKTVFVEREKDRREEKEEKCDDEFRKIMFENSPNSKDDFIIAEKGEWEE